MRRYHRNDKGFTMAEMLITVAIIVILCGFAFVAVIAHQRNLKRMEMDETAQEIFIAAQNHLTAAEANGQWDAFLKKTSGAASEAEAARGTWLQNGPTGYDKSTDKDADSRKFYSFTTESVEAVQKGAVSLILPEGSIDETLRGHHFYVEYDAVSGTVYGVFYTDADHAITAEDAANVSRTDANARRDYKDASGKRTIIGYYGGALGELKNSGDLYAPSVAVRNAESLVLYVVDKNYYRHVSAQGGAGTFQTQLKLTFEGETSKAAVEKTVDPAKVGSGTDSFSRSVLACDSAKEFSVIVPGRSADESGVQKTESVKAKYYAIVLDSIVREDGHFADLFAGADSGENGGSAQFIPGEDIKITVTLHSNNGGEDVSQTVTVNSLFNSVKQEKNALGLETGKAIVTVSNPRHLENLSTEVSGVDFTKIKSGTTIDTVSVVRNLFWDEDAAAGKVAKDQNENETVTAFLPAIASATGMESPFGYCADGSTSIAKDEIQVYPYQAGTGVGNTGENADKNSGSPNGDGAKAGGSENAAAEIAKGACYGITNTAIKTFEGNNHMLAAFRFEGEQKAALINEAADGLRISDLVIADATAAVTGQASSGNGTDPEHTPTAATLIADAKSGSLENIAVRWYEGSATSGTTNESVSLPAGKNLKTADGLEGCRVFSSKGIASALIGSIDAGAENADGKFTIQHTTVATVAASSSGKKTAPLGVEGETAAALVGQVKSGEVVLDNSSETDETKKSAVTVEGTLGLMADCGTKDNQTAGGLIGSIGQGKVQVKQFVLAADSVEINGAAAAGGVIGEVKSEKEQAVSLEDVNLVARSLKATSSEKYAGGLIGDSSGTGSVTVKNAALSLNTLEVNGKHAAGGAAGQISAGSSSFDGVHILTTKAAGDSGETGQAATGDEDTYGIRVTAENGMAGGLIGAATANVSKVEIQNTAVSGSGTADQVESGSSAGGLIGDTKADETTIRSSMVSLYIKSNGNGGNSGGSSSTDGAGGLIGSASGNVTATNSYSGGRTTNADNPEKKAGDAAAMQARYIDSAEGQGRYNVQLVAGSGAAGGLIGKYTGSSLTLTNSYSTSSVAVNKASGARAGGLIGEAEGSLTANNTYCTGRVYVALGAGESSSSTKEESTPNYGTYAGKLASISGQSNYYLKGMKGAPAGSVGTLGSNSQNPSVDEKILTGADYYDNNCPLKQGVDPAQKSYYYDSTITEKYAFKTVTTTYAKTLYDPNTGKKVENADADSSKYAQIGDWEIPAEESSETEFGPYALIYYERIWDPKTKSLDPTIYYHGYALPDGVQGTGSTAKYVEISTPSEKKISGMAWNDHHLVTTPNHYVAESGYLLLISDEVVEKEQRKDWGYKIYPSGNLSGNYDVSNDIIWQPSHLDQLRYQGNIEIEKEFEGYTLYKLDTNLSISYNKFDWQLSGEGKFGAGIVIAENGEKPVVAFTFMPFFADAVRGADQGKLNTVSASWAWNSKTKNYFIQNPANAIIRSADQLQQFASFDAGWDYLSHGVNFVLEQRMDISFDPNTVTFYENGNKVNDSSTKYISPTIAYIGRGRAGGEYRSALREGSNIVRDYYVLDGLNNTFVNDMQGGKLYDLQITNINAPYVIKKIHDYSGETSAWNIDIKESSLKNEFIGGIEHACVKDCNIFSTRIGGNGFAQKITGEGSKVGKCTITDSIIAKNGFAEVISDRAEISECKIIDTEIKLNGFSKENQGTIRNSKIVDANIDENGFVKTNTSTIEDCNIINAEIKLNGFSEENQGTIKNSNIINANIRKNGFAQKNVYLIEKCTIYGSQALYSDEEGSEYYSAHYRPEESLIDSTGKNKLYGYNLVTVGTKKDNESGENEDIAGFVNQNSGRITECSIVGKIYSKKNAAGFAIKNTGTIEKSYTNSLINAEKDAAGFLAELNDYNAVVNQCHALGKIEANSGATGFVKNITRGTVKACYAAYWNIKANVWYPFYETKSNDEQRLDNNYYLSNYREIIKEEKLNDYDGKVKGLSYQQLCDLYIEELKNQADSTVGYYQYMNNDNDHQTYPYPMPSGMTAYGDWSHTDPDSYTLLYYEKVDGRYYFHGYTTENGEKYTELKTSGANLENGLLVTTGKTVDEDGYLLIAGTNSSWSTFGRADNSGAVSSPVNNANTQILTAATDSDLLNALNNLQGLTKKDTDKIYIFQPDQYLKYQDTAKNFASWQTLTQESEGIGISIYSTKGAIPMARFSFQPFFADTVKSPRVLSKGTSNASEITFVTTKDDQEHDYRIRSLRQLQALSDWDAQKSTVADQAALKEKFDKDSSKRYSYLSTSNADCKDRLTIQQDMDIRLEGTSTACFQNVDGTYIGRKDESSNRSVYLQNLQKDFARCVASTGHISSLVLDEANYSAQKQGSDGIQHGENHEFVEYNYGTITDVTVQNSTLGSAGLVYQNGDMTKNVLKRVGNAPNVGQGKNWNTWFINKNGQGQNACQYTIKYTYEKAEEVKTGLIENCTVKDSTISGAGMVWRNKGGVIRNSSVEGCHNIGASGFVEYNEAASVQAPEWEEEYEYWVNLYSWTSNPGASGYRKVSDDIISEKNWPTKGNTSSATVSIMVDAVIENCSVRGSKYDDSTQGIQGDGFVGVNIIDTQGTAPSTAGSARAKISNCEVVDVAAAGSGFAGENLNGAEISNCAVYAETNNDGASAENIYAQSSIGSPQQEESSGFVGTNGESSVIDSCSFTGQIQGKRIGGFTYTNEGEIKNSYANIFQKWNNSKIEAAGFVYENSGEITYCHALGELRGSKVKTGGTDDCGSAAGFVWKNNGSAKIATSYTAIWSVAQTSDYWLFANKGNISGGTFANCYAMKPDSGYSTSDADGIVFVSGEDLESLKSELGVETGAETVTYTKSLGNYGFPVPTKITNYGDWHSEWTQAPDNNRNGTYAVSLTSGPGTFPEDAVAVAKALSADGTDENNISLDSMDDAESSASVADDPDGGSTNEIDLTLEPEEDENGETTATLDLSAFTPVRKGWKLLGWLITSPSDLSASEKKTTVSDIVTKINKISDGDAETEESDADSASDNSQKEETPGTDSSENAAEGSGETKDGQTEQNQSKTSGSAKAVYELETGTKSYHYAPDAVITVTEDMTLAAVWVPDEDTIAKAKDGTLRMDENGNVLDDDTDAASAGTSGNTSGNGKSDQAGTMLTEDNTQTAGTAKTDDTAFAGDTAQTAGTAQTGDAAGTTENGQVDAGQSGTGEMQDSAGTDPGENGATGQSDASGNTGSSEASTEAVTYSTENAEPVKDPGI